MSTLMFRQPSSGQPPAGAGPEAIAEFDAAQLDRLTEARATQVTALAEDGVWTATALGRYPETTCAINASAIAFIESEESPDGNFVRALVVQTNADIHNPYVFVGVRIGVYTDVFDNNNVVLTSFYHEASAGAVLDPAGNNRSYSWVDNQVMPEPRLNRINGVRIRFVNVS